MPKTDETIGRNNIIMQMIVLSIGFALVISWEAAIQPRLLAFIILLFMEIA